MIQLAHVATGAIAGRECSGVLDALAAGIATHALMDIVPHGEVHDNGFEAVTAIVSIASLAARYGVSSPLVWGAIGGILPDLEHVLPRRIRPEQSVFPTHRITWLHGWETKPLAVPAWVQATAGGAIVAALAAAATRQCFLRSGTK